MTRFLLIFCGVLGGLFVVEMLKPVQEAVIQPFTGLLAALSTAIILPFDARSSPGAHPARRHKRFCNLIEAAQWRHGNCPDSGIVAFRHR